MPSFSRKKANCLGFCVLVIAFLFSANSFGSYFDPNRSNCENDHSSCRKRKDGFGSPYFETCKGNWVGNWMDGRVYYQCIIYCSAATDHCPRPIGVTPVSFSALACKSTRDCSGDEFCSNGFCVSGRSCSSNYDCRAGGFCIRRTCVYGSGKLESQENQAQSPDGELCGTSQTRDLF